MVQYMAVKMKEIQRQETIWMNGSNLIMWKSKYQKINTAIVFI